MNTQTHFVVSNHTEQLIVSESWENFSDFNSKTSVNSKGAARSFVVLALFRILEYYRSEYTRTSRLVNFPPNSFDLDECIRLARNDALEVGTAWQNVFGGSVAFDIKNSGSYWTTAGHFTTFYKNNISRKSKFHSMKEESLSTSARGRSRYNSPLFTHDTYKRTHALFTCTFFSATILHLL